MGKAVYVGTVVAANNQQEAITSFLKTVNSTEDNKKCLFRISKSSDQVYLTTLSTIVSPMSPFTGDSDSPMVTSKMETIASALQLPNTNEIIAKDSFKLVSSVCPECDCVLVADSKKLLGHCIVCGAEQDQELEDEEHVDLSILNNEEEDEDGFDDEESFTESSEDEEDEDEEDFSGYEDEEDEELDTDEDEYEDEADIEAGSNEDEEDEDEDEEFDEVDEDEIEAMLAEADEEDETDTEESDEDDDVEFDDETDAGDEDEEEMYISEDEDDVSGYEDDVDACDSKVAIAKASDIGILDQLEVDLVADSLDATASIANTKVKLVYVPSEMIANHCWYAIVNDVPVAAATVHSVGAQKAEIFASESFRKATETLMAQVGVVAGLQDMGFQSMKIHMPVKQLVASNVAKETAKIRQEMEAQVQNMRDDLKAAMSTASVGINKGFFAKLTNPIKAELYDLLSNAGVRNAETLIDDAFSAKGDDYHRALLTQAFDLLSKPVDARNEISSAVASANYQRANSVDDGLSLSSTVAKQLGSIGTAPQNMIASQNEVQPSFNQRTANVMQGLVR
jgi:hypothetical protein